MLQVSRIKHPDRQLALWDWVGNRDFQSPAETRNAVGAFYQEAARVMFNAQEHATSGTADICPDLSLDAPLRYLEVKSVGQTRQALIYSHRLARDIKLARETGARMGYVFFIHDVAAMQCTTLHQLRALLADRLQRIAVVPLRTVAKLCADHPARVMNYRLATATKPAQPMEGHRIPLRRLIAAASADGQQRMAWGCDAFGLRVTACPIVGELKLVGM